MFTLINRGELPPTTEHELENFNSRLKALWLTEHNEDGTHRVLNPNAIPPLDASKIVTGTLSRTVLPAQVAYTDVGNTFTLGQNITTSTGTVAGIKTRDAAGGATIWHFGSFNQNFHITENGVATWWQVMKTSGVLNGSANIQTTAIRPQVALIHSSGVDRAHRIEALTPNQVGLFTNMSYNGSFNLDLTTESGWLLRLINSSEGDLFEVSRASAGANPRSPTALLSVSATGVTTTPQLTLNGTRTSIGYRGDVDGHRGRLVIASIDNGVSTFFIGQDPSSGFISPLWNLHIGTGGSFTTQEAQLVMNGSVFFPPRGLNQTAPAFGSCRVYARIRASDGAPFLVFQSTNGVGTPIYKMLQLNDLAATFVVTTTPP